MMTKTETRHCAQHGEFESVRYIGERWTGCPACSREQEVQRQQELELAQRAERQQQMLRQSGIVGRYVECTLDTFSASTKAQRAAVATCRSFVENFHRDQGSGLFLIGPPGTGKTHLGAAMLREIILRHSVPAQIISARAIVRRLRNTWRRDPTETEDDVIEDLAGQALLVLDEVGGGFNSEGEIVQLFDVIDARYQLQAPTVLLSNLTPSLLKSTLGDRLYDRLREGARVIVCDWPSYRGSIQ